MSTQVNAFQIPDTFHLQNVPGRDLTALDGLWSIIVDPLENGYYNYRWQPRADGYFMDRQMEHPSDLIEYNFDTDYQLMVPGDWNTQMEKLYYYEGTVWYKRNFDLEAEKEGSTYLYFGAVHYQAIVYLNGEKIGEHIGGYTPFYFNVTDKLKEKDNLLVVKVDNERKREAIPTINTDWWNYGGITRSVYLVQMPDQHIYDYKIQLDPDNKERVKGWVKTKNTRAGDQVKISIPELKIQHSYEVDRDGMAVFSFPAQPEFWSTTNPKLYNVEISTGKDIVKDEIGFRTISTEGSKILLNGKEVFLKGISIHEEAPFKTGRVTSVEQARILLRWAKELGSNFVRLAHYPHNEEMVREAEKMGLLVWSEIPVYWTVLFDNPETYQNAENQLTEMINRDKNRAGVVLWSVANETPVGKDRNSFLQRLSKKARELDNTRLITAALEIRSRRNGANLIEDPFGKYVDVIGINSYCGWYGGTPESCKDLKWVSDYDKPVIISEFGGGALQGLHGSKEERWTEEYQASVYKNNIEMLKNIDFLAGTSPWILMDFRSHRRHLRKIQADFNRKGLISEQGDRKKAFYILQDYYGSFEN
jgi:beta-glucuronidase